MHRGDIGHPKGGKKGGTVPSTVAKSSKRGKREKREKKEEGKGGDAILHLFSS